MLNVQDTGEQRSASIVNDTVRKLTSILLFAVRQCRAGMLHGVDNGLLLFLVLFRRDVAAGRQLVEFRDTRLR